ncbi:MAG: CppA family protein [Streptococcaceae bacterium]|nr:CppA family protein [Streptococcaceae bacterium]
MSIFEVATGIRPVYRVNDREENLRFYRDVLGLKVLLEEGAMVELGGTDGVKRLLLEESPADWGFRKVEGRKRHVWTVLIAEPVEIAGRLAHEEVSAQATRVVEGASGLVAEFVSPEGDVFVLASQLKDLSNLTDNTAVAVKVDTDETAALKGLSDVEVAEVRVAGKTPKWESRFVKFDRVSGEVDLTARDTWDLEAIEFLVPEDTDLSSYGEEFDDYYLDAPEKLLTVSDRTGLELWFEK